jgi:hypothetical protein
MSGSVTDSHARCLGSHDVVIERSLLGSLTLVCLFLTLLTESKRLCLARLSDLETMEEGRTTCGSFTASAK